MQDGKSGLAVTVLQERNEDWVDSSAFGEGLLGEFGACACLLEAQTKALRDGTDAASRWHAPSKPDPCAQLHKR